MYMEGPSLHLAAEQLQPFAGRKIRSVAGNSKIGIQRLSGLEVREIFAWGKHLVFQFDTFALRVHFMLWGTFAATVKGRSVTGDYRRSGPPRLVLNFPNGEITIWAASVRFVEGANARAAYDFSADIMAGEWDGRAALAKVKAFPRGEIADVLLDQAIFAGVGNIIKNEVLFRMRVSPFAKNPRHIGPQVEGGRRRCANFLVSISGASPGFHAAQESRGVPAKCLPAVRR